eukprot:jgi/Botrbrau1/8573/Bobra.0359s0036.1
MTEMGTCSCLSKILGTFAGSEEVRGCRDDVTACTCCALTLLVSFVRPKSPGLHDYNRNRDLRDVTCRTGYVFMSSLVTSFFFRSLRCSLEG